MLLRTAVFGQCISLFDTRKDTTLVDRSEKLMCFHVVLMICVSSRFTPGVAAQPEKKRTGPSQADVEAIKVRLLTEKKFGTVLQGS